MRIGHVAGLGVAAWLLAVSTAGADVRLTMQNGRVSLVAKDATLRQIMAEWARVGQTKVVNVERITGGPMSLELSNVTERQALDILLRSVSGYVLAPRSDEAPALSLFDRIIVMPTSVAPRTPAGGGPTTISQPQLPPPGPADDEDGPSIQPPRGPVFTNFPPPQFVNPLPGMPEGQGGPPQGAVPGTAPIPAAFPGAPTSTAPTPMGTTRPGEIIPAPQPVPAQPPRPPQ